MSDTTTGMQVDEMMLADMNGPLGYWGPASRPAATAVKRRPATELLLSPSDHEALTKLGETLHGRTWAGTNTLMSALFAIASAQERQPVAA